jgi:Zn-finger nucleic acid-binding protein
MVGSGAALDAARRVFSAVRRDRDRLDVLHERRHDPWALPSGAGPVPAVDSSAVDRIVAQLKAGDLPRSTRVCPLCGDPFVLLDVDGVQVDTCLACGVFWFDAGELGDIARRHDDLPGSSVVRPAASPVRCPVCRQDMQERVFLTHRHVTISECAGGHGIFLSTHQIRLNVSEMLHMSLGCKDHGPWTMDHGLARNAGTVCPCLAATESPCRTAGCCVNRYVGTADIAVAGGHVRIPVMADSDSGP